MNSIKAVFSVKDLIFLESSKSLIYYEKRYFGNLNLFSKLIKIIVQLVTFWKVKKFYTNDERLDNKTLYFFEKKYLFNENVINFLKLKDDLVTGSCEKSSKNCIKHNFNYNILNPYILFKNLNNYDFLSKIYIYLILNKYYPLVTYIHQNFKIKELVSNDAFSIVTSFFSLLLCKNKSQSKFFVLNEVTEYNYEYTQVMDSAVFVESHFSKAFNKFYGKKFIDINFAKNFTKKTQIKYDIIFFVQYYVNYGDFDSLYSFLLKNIYSINKLSRSYKVLVRFHPNASFLEKFFLRIYLNNVIFSSASLENDCFSSQTAVSFNSTACKNFNNITNRSSHFILKK